MKLDEEHLMSSLDTLADALRPLRGWLFANNVPRDDEGYYQITLPPGTDLILRSGRGKILGFSITAPHREERPRD